MVTMVTVMTVMSVMSVMSMMPVMSVMTVMPVMSVMYWCRAESLIVVPSLVIPIVVVVMVAVVVLVPFELLLADLSHFDKLFIIDGIKMLDFLYGVNPFNTYPS